jgi:hypothetical protein
MSASFFLFSYIDNNTECSSGFKRYNKQIPHYLHNCPDYLVDHCLKRLIYADEAKIQTINDNTGIFSVKSETNNSYYIVQAFYAENMPNVELIPTKEISTDFGPPITY